MLSFFEGREAGEGWKGGGGGGGGGGERAGHVGPGALEGLEFGLGS